MDLTKEVFRHFGLDIEAMRQKIGRKVEGVDWGICTVEDAQKLTNNMAGFGMEQSQRIIIDFDKNYKYVLIRREEKSENQPAL